MVWNMNGIWRKEEWSATCHFSFDSTPPLFCFLNGIFANEYVIGCKRMKIGFMQFSPFLFSPIP